MANEITKTSDNIEDLFNMVSGLIEQARSSILSEVFVISFAIINFIVI